MKLYLENSTTNNYEELSAQDFKKMFDHLKWGVYDREALELVDVDDEGNLYFTCFVTEMF